jgi:hypothetical protein
MSLAAMFSCEPRRGRGGRAGVGELVVVHDDLAAHDGGKIAAGTLNETLAAGGQIAVQAWPVELQRFEIHGIQVRLLADGDGAAILETQVTGRVLALRIDWRPSLRDKHDGTLIDWATVRLRGSFRKAIGAWRERRAARMVQSSPLRCDTP